MSSSPVRIGQALGDVTHYSLGDMRRRMAPSFASYRWSLLIAAVLVAAVVLQDPFMFDTTIEKNLRMVRQNATDDEIRDALEKAGSSRKAALTDSSPATVILQDSTRWQPA